MKLLSCVFNMDTACVELILFLNKTFQIIAVI